MQLERKRHRITLTASISLSAFHCSYGTPNASAVWMVRFIWLVHTLRSFIFWSWINLPRPWANWHIRETEREMVNPIDQSCRQSFTDTYTVTHLFTTGRQAWIPSDATSDVEVALSMATEVDGAWCDVDVHQIINDSALNVVEDAVHQIPLTHVHYLNVWQLPVRKYTTLKKLNTKCINNMMWYLLSGGTHLGTNEIGFLTCLGFHPVAGNCSHSIWSSS